MLNRERSSKTFDEVSMGKFLGILIAFVIALFGLYFLPISQSRVQLAQNNLSRAVRAAMKRLAIGAEYSDVHDINPTSAPARKTFCLSDDLIYSPNLLHQFGSTQISRGGRTPGFSTALRSSRD